MFDDTQHLDERRWTKVIIRNKLDQFILKFSFLLIVFSIVVYEGGSVMSQARSLWRLELARTKWTGGFINWFHPMRIRHITSGRYLGVNENNELTLVMLQLSHDEKFKFYF